MNDPIAITARASAERLAAEFGPSLPADVEAALHARGSSQRPEQFIDPVSLGILIVGIATLAWTVYTDLRKRTDKPSPDVMARTIRLELRDRGEAAVDVAARDRMNEIIVSETVSAASHDSTATSPDDPGSGPA